MNFEEKKIIFWKKSNFFSLCYPQGTQGSLKKCQPTWSNRLPSYRRDIDRYKYIYERRALFYRGLHARGIKKANFEKKIELKRKRILKNTFEFFYPMLPPGPCNVNYYGLLTEKYNFKE